jgi:diguanylate cyclase (GGDEF)-like protein/PAS domain S-box-containing protein
MLAYDPGIAVAYDIGLTALSLLAAAVVTTIGLGVAIYGTHRWSAPIGGGIVGGGVACMHYLGMFALDLPGRVTWAPDLVIASIALGMAFGVAALAVGVRRDGAGATFAAAILLTLAIVSHHFTAMGAVLILPDPTRVVDPFALAPGMLALAIAGIAIAVLGMSLAGALTDRHLADRAVEAAARFHGLAEAATEALAICDGDTIVDVNSSLERLTGLTAAELKGRPVRTLFHGGNAALGTIASEVMVVTQKGELIACDAAARTIPYRDSIRTVVSIRDLRERKHAEARIIHLAHHDPLTDLPNRAAFNERLEMTLENADRTGTPFAVLCIDFDRFKEVNDVFGHLVGDSMLREVARRMHEAAKGNFIARLGGDEFTIIVEGDQPSSAAEAVAARLQAAVAQDIFVDGHELRVGLSIGVGVYPQDGMDAATLLVHADAALYRAKADGRGTIRFFDADMDQRLRERRALQLDLRQALARNEIHLHYQPQARIDGTIIGFEVLARWDHPTRGPVPPATFIPLAEESGLIIQIGEWILRTACLEAASWKEPLQIAVNLSPVQFRHGNLPALVHSLLLESGLPANRLELEVTESVLIGDFSRAVLILRQLKALGIRIAMDDFGTGYSSLSYLQSFPFDKIKIDSSFVANLEKGSQSAAIIRAVIGLGRGLELPVMAEGVETREQREFLSIEACDEMQGFLIGRPRPIEDYADVVGSPARRPQLVATG